MRNIYSASNLLMLLIFVALATVFFFPTLFAGATMIHGETVSLWIPLSELLHQAINNDGPLLWTNRIYGGHPIFAEGQGAFAHPIRLLIGALFNPITGYNIYNWLNLVLPLIGMYGLCRSIQCSRSASLFAALAVCFSTLAIGARGNMAMAGAVTWVPWAIWAMLHWYQRPSVKSAIFLGTAMCLMIMSGYPHIVHATMIYLAVYLLIIGCSSSGRVYIQVNYIRLLTTGGGAVLICAGLAAVQWIPLLELVGQSHRNDGVDIAHIAHLKAISLGRGFLFTFAENDAAMSYFTVVGSALVCVVASTALLFRMSAQLAAHTAATVACAILGFGTSTPIFNWLYDQNLVPGLHSFRIMFLYLHLTIAGISIIAAMSIDRLCNSPRSGYLRWHRILIVLLWCISWLLIIRTLHLAEVPPLHYLTLACAFTLIVLLILFNRQSLIPLSLAVILLIEVLMLRIDSIAYAQRSVISEPASAIFLKQQAPIQDYKVMDTTTATAYAFWNPKSKKVTFGMQQMINSISPSSNMLWDINSLSGNLALQTQRQHLAQEIIRKELNAKQQQKPGLRLIDYLSLRYITYSPPIKPSGFKAVYHDQKLNVFLAENLYAHPKFQLFDEVIFVDSTEEAITAIGQLTSSKLIIEREQPSKTMNEPEKGSLDIRYQLIHDNAQDYQLNIEAASHGWLFLADSYYPGWKAYIDGTEVPLYPAQILGKAVEIPQGSYHLRLVFEPQTVKWGLYISLFTAILVALALVYLARNPIPIKQDSKTGSAIE